MKLNEPFWTVVFADGHIPSMFRHKTKEEAEITANSDMYAHLYPRPRPICIKYVPANTVT